MTRDQIKKIVRLTEAIVNKRLNETTTGKLREDGYDQYGEPIQRNSGGSLYAFYIKNPSIKAKIKAHGRWQNVVDERNGKYVINSSHIDDFTDFIRDNGYDLGTDIIFESKNTKKLNESDQFPVQMGSNIEFLDKRRAEFRSIMTSVFKFQDKYDLDIKLDSKFKTLRGLMDQIMGMM